MDEGNAAVDWVRTHAGELGIDPDRVVFWSCSANVRIGSRLPALPEQPRLRGAVFYYGVMEAATVRADLPTLVVRAGRDSPEINTTIERWMAEAMARGAAVEFVHAPGLHHAFDIEDDVEPSRALAERTLAWMKRRAG